MLAAACRPHSTRQHSSSIHRSEAVYLPAPEAYEVQRRLASTLPWKEEQSGTFTVWLGKAQEKSAAPSEEDSGALPSAAQPLDEGDRSTQTLVPTKVAGEARLEWRGEGEQGKKIEFRVRKPVCAKSAYESVAPLLLAIC